MLKREIDNYGEHSAQVFASSDDSILLVRSAFKTFAGEIPASPYLRIGLNLGGGGVVKQWSGTRFIEEEWSRGALTVWSGDPCYAQCPTVDMLGLAVNLNAWHLAGRTELSADNLTVKTFQIINDEFMSAMLMALWRSAQIYGISTVFFEQGVRQILERLSAEKPQRQVLLNRRPLTKRALTRVQELVKDKLQTDLSVAQMAGLLQMDETSFAKSFARSTGLTPFAYITAQRMEKAQALLKLDFSVTDVATSVGYTNPSKFAAAFRRYVGITPSVWRKMSN